MLGIAALCEWGWLLRWDCGRKNAGMQRLLLEEAGLSFKDLEYMSRWGAYAPKVAGIASLPVTGRKRSNGGQQGVDRRRRLIGDETNTRQVSTPMCYAQSLWYNGISPMSPSCVRPACDPHPQER